MKTFAIALSIILSAPTSTTGDWDSLIETIEHTPVTQSVPSTDYDREAQFGPAWKDIDHNGCDTRNDILARDLDNVVLAKNKCQVRSGTLTHDMYSGSTIEFVRGQGNCTQTVGVWNGQEVTHKRLGVHSEGGCSEAIQIDHVVPLALAWRNGADTWTQEQREKFANDPINLVASDGALNRMKSDKGPSQWLPDPDAGGDTCAYVARYANVYANYPLTITREDKETLLTNLRECRDTGTAPSLEKSTVEKRFDVNWWIVISVAVLLFVAQLWFKHRFQVRRYTRR